MNSAANITAEGVAAMPSHQETDFDSLDLIWGCAAIGRVIGKTAKATYYMCEAGELPVKQIGSRWVASRRKLQEHFEGAAG